MNVVLIPAFNRAEFLTIALEHIATNPDFKENYYLLAFDHGGRSDNPLVFSDWLQKHAVRGHVTNRELRYTGLMKQSWNVIQGYREALSITDELVYMIEDDIMISPYFFRWHKAIPTDISIGTRSVRIPFEPIENLELYYLASDYQSLGVCFKKGTLAEFLTYFTDTYFENPRLAIKNHFGINPPVSLNFVEQDALFHNIIKSRNIQVGFSAYGLAFHAGFSGKSRGKRVTGSLSEKVAKIKNIIYDPEKMKQVIIENGDPIGYFEDSKPIKFLDWSGKLKPLNLAT